MTREAQTEERVVASAWSSAQNAQNQASLALKKLAVMVEHDRGTAVQEAELALRRALGGAGGDGHPAPAPRPLARPAWRD